MAKRSNIEQAAAAVAQWRASQRTNTTDLPTDLQQQVVKLLEEHTWAEVCEVVAVKRSRLARWRRVHAGACQLRQRSHEAILARPSSPTPEFIELTLPTQATAVGTNDALAVELCLPSGIVLRARSDSNPAAVTDLITKLLTNSAMR